jgi:hypothetical protein
MKENNIPEKPGMERRLWALGQTQVPAEAPKANIDSSYISIPRIVVPEGAAKILGQNVAGELHKDNLGKKVENHLVNEILNNPIKPAAIKPEEPKKPEVQVFPKEDGAKEDEGKTKITVANGNKEKTPEQRLAEKKGAQEKIIEDIKFKQAVKKAEEKNAKDAEKARKKQEKAQKAAEEKEAKPIVDKKGIAIVAVILTVAALGLIAANAKSCERGSYAPPASPTTSSAAGQPNPNPVELERQAVSGYAIPVPRNLSEIKVANLGNGFKEGQWFHPVYNSLKADLAHNWEGIGPHYPVAFSNIDRDAAQLISHSNVGELIVKAKNGGKVQINFMQIDQYQTDGAWGQDANGNTVQNRNWAMQYTFKGVPHGMEFHMVDPDTGAPLTWEDGKEVVYTASDLGDFSFEMPKTYGNDVRVGIVFNMPAARSGEQAFEMKIERGPNDHPELKGENPLPGSVIKYRVPGK